MSSRVTDRELLAYAAGELHGAEAARIEALLRVDPAAAASVARYRAAREALAADNSVPTPAAIVARAKAIFTQAPQRSLGETVNAWLARLDVVIARVLFDSRVQPALAGFRGGSEPFQAAWEAGDAEIEVEGSLIGLAQRPGGPRRWQITGQVTSGAPAATITLVLARAGTREAVAVADADESGMFTFEVSADRYDLMVRVDDSAFVVRDLELA